MLHGVCHYFGRVTLRDPFLHRLLIYDICRHSSLVLESECSQSHYADTTNYNTQGKSKSPYPGFLASSNLFLVEPRSLLMIFRSLSSLGSAPTFEKYGSHYLPGNIDNNTIPSFSLSFKAVATPCDNVLFTGNAAD